MYVCVCTQYSMLIVLTMIVRQTQTHTHTHVEPQKWLRRRRLLKHEHFLKENQKEQTKKVNEYSFLTEVHYVEAKPHTGKEAIIII